jgi:hypothetical protein
MRVQLAIPGRFGLGIGVGVGTAPGVGLGDDPAVGDLLFPLLGSTARANAAAGT